MKQREIAVFAFALAVLLSPVAVFAGIYDAAYSAYKTITFTPSTLSGDLAPQAGFPLLVRFKSKNSGTGREVLLGSVSSGLDVRFSSADGSTALPFEMERWSDTAAEYWVRIPVLNGTSGGIGVPTQIRVYYGSFAAEDTSSPSAVFDTAAGFRAVWHMNGATSTSDEDDATQNKFEATVYGAPTPSFGGIGGSRSLTQAAAVGADSAAFIVGLSQSNFGVHMINASTGLAVGYSGLVLKTTDSGSTWTTVKTGTRGNGNNNSNILTMNAVTCANSTVCYAVGGGAGPFANSNLRAIYKSTDAGSSWVKQDSINNSGGPLYGISCNNDTSCVAVGGNTTTTRAFSNLQSAGTSWNTTVAALGTLYGVHCVPNPLATDKYCYAVGGPSSDTRVIYRWINTDGTWSSVRQDSTVGPGALFGVHCLDKDICYAVGNNGVILKSVDASTLGTWTSLPSGTTKNLHGIHCINALTCVAVGNALPSLAASDSSTILKTTDGGLSWSKKLVGALGDSLFAVKFTDPLNGIIVGGNGTVLRSNDGGEIWRLNANSRKLAFRVNGAYDYGTALLGAGAGDNYSLSAWVNPSSASGGQQSIVGKGDFHWMLQSNASNQFSVAERNFMAGTGGTFTSFPTGVTGSQNVNGALVSLGWHHVMSVRVNNTAGGTLVANVESLYVDGGSKCGGSQVGTANVAGSGSILTGSGRGGLDAVAIGRGTNLYQRHWKSGPIDEVRIEGKPRSADWVCLTYQSQNTDTNAYYAKVVMGLATSLRPADRNGSNVFQIAGNGAYAFAIPAGMAGAAELRVVDVTGRTVWSSSVRLDGTARTIRWNGRDAGGNLAPAGMYFARLRTVNQGKTREVALKGTLTH